MESLFSILIILAMIAFFAPFIVWIFIKFASHQGEYFENKGKVLLIVFAVCMSIFAILCILMVWVGFQIDPNPVKDTLSYMLNI